MTAAHLPGAGFVRDGWVEALDLDGRGLRIALGSLRWIAFVRDWNRGEADPERLPRRTFLARPRVQGLWVRVTFGVDDVLEGLAAPDLTLLDEVWRDGGVMLLPPDTRSNTQRLFVPCAAMAAFQVLGVVTTPSKKAAGTGAGSTGLLFPE